MQMGPTRKLSKKELYNFDPGEKTIHVLVDVPSAEVPMEKLLGELKWNEPNPLCRSSGRVWPYQGTSKLAANLKTHLVEHYDTWREGLEDKQNHALFLVLSGLGTGKSRMLDEMKGLLCEAATQSGRPDIRTRVENAYVFHISFENDTATTGSLLVPKIPEFDISYRLLYQLAKERRGWGQFVACLIASYSSLHPYIATVIEMLAKLEKIDNVKGMTVILCVDGLQKLHNDAAKPHNFYGLLSAVCSFLNGSRDFAICVCASTTGMPVHQDLRHFHQKRVSLLPPVLCGQTILPRKTRFEKQLVDDIGGHGRALEVLENVFSYYRGGGLENIDPADVVDRVCNELRTKQGDMLNGPLFADRAKCQEVLGAILPRSFYGLTNTIAGTTVDEWMSCKALVCFG